MPDITIAGGDGDFSAYLAHSRTAEVFSAALK